MTKDEARNILQNKGSVRFEVWTWSNYIYYCQSNGDGGYECCYESFNTVEDMVGHLESICGGRWEEVEEEY